MQIMGSADKDADCELDFMEFISVIIEQVSVMMEMSAMKSISIIRQQRMASSYCRAPPSSYSRTPCFGSIANELPCSCS